MVCRREGEWGGAKEAKLGGREDRDKVA